MYLLFMRTGSKQDIELMCIDLLTYLFIYLFIHSSIHSFFLSFTCPLTNVTRVTVFMISSQSVIHTQ